MGRLDERLIAESLIKVRLVARSRRLGNDRQPCNGQFRQNDVIGNCGCPEFKLARYPVSAFHDLPVHMVYDG